MACPFSTYYSVDGIDDFSTYALTPTVDKHRTHAYDWAVSARYDITDSWLASWNITMWTALLISLT